jgi:hypothetical protein
MAMNTGGLDNEKESYLEEFYMLKKFVQENIAEKEDKLVDLDPLQDINDLSLIIPKELGKVQGEIAKC